MSDRMTTTPKKASSPIRLPRGWLLLRRSASACQEAGQVVPEIVNQTLRAPGKPLEAGVRQEMESRFHHDFSQVRVHTGRQAAESARAVGALAYSAGDQIAFADGEYDPHSPQGRELLAHELVHVVQQGQLEPRPDMRIAPASHPLERQAAASLPGLTQPTLALASAPLLARQCDPAWAGLDWSARVANVRAMANGAAKNQCMADMIDEALYPNVTVHQSTNTAATVNAAIATGRYTEWNTISDLQVNFDNNLAAKGGGAGLYGRTVFRTPTANTIEIYIILGPNALDPIGPQFTRMAFDHENSHAGDFLIQFAIGTPHAATAGEELAIYAEMFSLYFLDMWDINNAACRWGLADDFRPLFSYYVSASALDRDKAFDSLKLFYEVRIRAIPCNLMKFKIWLQSVMNARLATDAFIQRINALPGLGLRRGTPPNNHFNCGLGCG